MIRTGVIGLCVLGFFLAGCGGSKSRTIDGVDISLIAMEYGNVLKEGYSNVTASKGQEFIRLVFLFKAKEKPVDETIAKIKKWKVRIVDTAGKECGPMNGWIIVDRYASKVRVYSNPVPLGTRLRSVTIGKVTFPLSDVLTTGSVAAHSRRE